MRISSLPYWIPIFLALSMSACGQANQNDFKTQQNARIGKLPPQTAELIDEEWKIYRAQNPDIDETTARRQFDIIQIMSAEHYDPDTAAWAERKILAETWLKTQIEDVYNPGTVNDKFIQAAIDAYAFKSGHPALATVSHVLIHKDKVNTPDKQRAALEAIRSDLVKKNDFSDEALREAAEKLIHAGFRADMNENLTFPRDPVTSFMGEQINYHNVVEEFGEASFRLSKDNPISPVVETEFGFHLIAFRKLEPGIKASLEKDREFMRSNIILNGRKLATAQRIDQLMHEAEIKINEAEINKIVGIRPQDATQDASVSK